MVETRLDLDLQGEGALEVKTLARSFGSLLTTKYGNLNIGDEDQIKAESKTEIVSKAKQESAEVRIGCKQNRQSSSRTRLADQADYGNTTRYTSSGWVKVLHMDCHTRIESWVGKCIY